MTSLLVNGAHIPHVRAQQLFSGQDAAYPEGPENAQILCIYIGGPDALHVWTSEMANHYYAVNPKTVFLPIWVDSKQGYTTGTESGVAATVAAKRYGFAPNMPGVTRRWIAVDAEVSTNYAYYAQCGAAIQREGFRMLTYRSLDTQGPVASSELWAADWTDVQPTDIPWAGQQWEAGPVWDKDVFQLEVYTGCGTGPRK